MIRAVMTLFFIPPGWLESSYTFKFTVITTATMTLPLLLLVCIPTKEVVELTIQN